MIRKTLNKIFSSKVFYVIFALLVAGALWMYVEITENQEQSHRVADVPIVFRNADILRDRGLLITNKEPQSLVLTFEVPLNVANQLSNSTVFAEVNLANVTRAGHITEDYTIIFPSGINPNTTQPVQRSVERISLLIDRLSARTIPVRGEYTGGTAADDLFAAPVEFEPQTITVEGPDDVISRISHATVPIFRENLATTYIDDLSFFLIDTYGYELDGALLDLISTSHELINVTVPIRQEKTVPLTVELVHGAGSSEQNTNWSVDPPFITISGDPEAVRDINQIHLRTIDTTMFSFLGTDIFPIIVPTHIDNDSGETEANVRVEVIGLDIEDFSVDSIFVVNMPAGHHLEWISTSTDVRVRGRREYLDQITEMNIRVVADLRDFSAGRHRMLARVYIDGIDGDVGAVGETRISLRIVADTQ